MPLLPRAGATIVSETARDKDIPAWNGTLPARTASIRRGCQDPAAALRTRQARSVTHLLGWPGRSMSITILPE